MEKDWMIILDAARMNGNIYQARELNDAHRCLYEGDSEKFLGSTAPWLFQLERFSHFADWVVELGAGDNWGLILQSEAEPEVIYRHLRKFLIVQTEEGKELYFRFYDPRVLRIFLPTCDTEQLLEFFGPLEAFIMEDEEGKMVQFQLNGSQLEMFDLGMSLKGWMEADEVPKPEQKMNPSETEPINPNANQSKTRWDFGY